MDRASGAVRMAAFVPLFIATMFGSPPATAGKPSIKEIQELINKGQYYFEEERFEEALENYEKAHEASGQHLLLFMIARCHQRLDHTRDALETFRAFLARPDIPEGPRGKAEMAVQVLEEELERGTIVIQVTPFGAEVRVDGEPLGNAPVAPLETRPGTHEIDVRAEGFGPVHRVVSLAPAGEVRVAVELQPLSELPLEQPPGSSEPADGQRFSPWSWVAVGVGAAAVIAGGATWAVASHNADEIDGSYDKSTWTTEQKSAYDKDWDENVVPYQNSSYILWGVGGAVFVTGTVLAVLDLTREDSVPDTVGVTFVPVLSPQVAGLSLQMDF